MAPQPTNPDSSLSPVWGGEPVSVERGRGSYLYAGDSSYLDFTSGIGVTSTGHCHPVVVDAICAQANLLLHAQPTVARSEPLRALAAALSELLPLDLDCAFFANSGSEAVEGALKLARQTTGRPNVIAFQGGYHGRTLGALSLTSAKPVYRAGYQPLPAGTFIAPYPSAASGLSTDACIECLSDLLAAASPPDETAAVVVEPVLGEGGYVVPPSDFLRKLRRLCDESQLLLIFDEVQTGCGRTGKMFASEHFNVWPDVLILSKGLASGMPISCIVASQGRMGRWREGSHGGTFGGNPVCAAAALATLKVIRDEALVEHAAHMGDYLCKALYTLAEQSPVGMVARGLGLMVGCEFTTAAGVPQPLIAAAVKRLCRDGGLLLSTCGTYDHVIRWVPPLSVSKHEIDIALRVFEDAVSEVGVRSGLLKELVGAS